MRETRFMLNKLGSTFSRIMTQHIVLPTGLNVGRFSLAFRFNARSIHLHIDGGGGCCIDLC